MLSWMKPGYNQLKGNMKPYTAKEWKVICIRETPCPDELKRADTPDTAVAYWREVIETNPLFNQDVETLIVLLMNTRRKVKGHALVASGTLDTILAHPREIFRPALVSAASAIILMHNHPSGDPTPSEADVKMTRDIARAGQLLKIELLDHIVVGHPKQGKGYVSLLELGYFTN
jgi:DNA repair protein RadC